MRRLFLLLASENRADARRAGRGVGRDVNRSGEFCWRSWAAAFCSGLLIVFSTSSVLGESLHAQRDTLNQQYARQLGELAAECVKEGEADLADTVSAWLPSRHPDQLIFFDLARSDASRPDGSPSGQRFSELRRQQADALFALAEDASRGGRGALAHELVHECLREDPDHAVARAVLGHVRLDDGWCTPFEARQNKSGQVWHDRYGWLSAGDVERYERGERRYRRRWISADKDRALHDTIRDGWRVRTEHFEVRTNHSLEEGVALSRRLERLHAVWRQLFIRFVVSDRVLERRFAKQETPSRSTRRHRVVYYRDRDQYNEALRARQPRIGMTLGIYFAEDRTAYFFAGEQQEPGTVLHEATHQLFQESRPTSRAAGQRSNFWIIEAVACYMESLTRHQGYYTLGGADAGRMPAAQFRLLESNFYVPFEEITGFGRDTLQRHRQLPMLYSQMAGQAAFLVHYDHGRYRQPMVDYLRTVYSGRTSTDALPRLLETEFSSLDREYREFITKLAKPEIDD